MKGNGPRVLAALEKVAAEASHTLAQVALAWVAAKITAPIASATSVAQVKELIGAMNLELTDEQVAVLDAASAGADGPRSRIFSAVSRLRFLVR